MIDVLNIGVAALIVGLALWITVARDNYAAVVGFIAYGLLLSLAWVQLNGIDVALTEAAIGGGPKLNLTRFTFRCEERAIG